MSTEVAALERHLRHHPGDWSSWLVYADWLTDRGDPSGACIVHSHALEVLRPDGAARRAHRLALDALAVQRRGPPPGDWPDPVQWSWRFGRLVGVQLGWTEDAEALLVRLATGDHARLWAHLTVNRMEAGAVDALVGSGALEVVGELDLSAGWLGDRGIEKLVRSPAVAGIGWMRLAMIGLSADGVAALGASPHLAELRHLDLSHNMLQAGLGGLDGPGLPSLRLLVLRGCGLGFADHAWLAEVAARRGWRVLLDRGTQIPASKAE